MAVFGLLMIGALIDVGVLYLLMRRGADGQASDVPTSILASFISAMAMFYGTAGIGVHSIVAPLVGLSFSFLFIVLCGKFLTSIKLGGIVRIAVCFSIYRIIMYTWFSHLATQMTH